MPTTSSSEPHLTVVLFLFPPDETNRREQDRGDRESGRDKGSYEGGHKRGGEQKSFFVPFFDRRLPFRSPTPPFDLLFREHPKTQYQNQFDSIDLSDNGVLTLDGLPRLTRLGTLLLSNNRISRIGPDLEQFAPNLSTLVLTNNALRNLADLDALASLPKLERLSCVDNVVAKKPLYR